MRANTSTSIKYVFKSSGTGQFAPALNIGARGFKVAGAQPQCFGRVNVINDVALKCGHDGRRIMSSDLTEPCSYSIPALRRPRWERPRKEAPVETSGRFA